MQNILYHLWGECRFFFNSHEFSHERRRLSNYEDKAIKAPPEKFLDQLTLALI